ncbi:MAG TPA: hypothetical protein VHN14_27270 [Kofleriaceae bacterium]|nr:hypothetical protein [Kofleriaceae bacterium]
MPGRASKLLLAAGFVIVLALAIGLVRLTRSATQAAMAPLSSHGPVAPRPAPAGEFPASGSPPIVAREHHPTTAATTRPQVAMPGQKPELAPAQVGFDRELKRDANGKLVPIITVKELRERYHLVDAPMKACLERSGKRPTGKATLSFTVAARNNKLVIDTTGVQDEETLAGSPELLECMRQAAKAIVLDGYAVPELGTPIYVRRHVRIEDGALAEDAIFDFSYNP